MSKEVQKDGWHIEIKWEFGLNNCRYEATATIEVIFKMAVDYMEMRSKWHLKRVINPMEVVFFKHYKFEFPDTRFCYIHKKK